MQLVLEYKTISNRHQQYLKESSATLRRREHSGWPEAEKEPYRQKAAIEARPLKEDYQHLFKRT